MATTTTIIEFLTFLAPANSMWSDGSPQTAGNLGFDSGLDGSHCCVKVEVFDQDSNGSVWWGEDCENILYGICEFRVEEAYLDKPANLTTGNETSSTSLEISWSGENLHWAPDTFTVDFCHKKSLSTAALPIKGDQCGIREVEEKRQTVLIQGLETFSEYEVVVKGKMKGFMRETSAKFRARTRKYIFCEILNSRSVLVGIKYRIETRAK